MLVFMMPETRYIRNTKAASFGNSLSPSVGLDPNSKDNNTTTTQTAIGEKPITAGNQVPNHIQLASSNERVVGKSSKAQLSPMLRPQFETKNIILRDIVAPTQIFTFPLICWVAFAFGFTTNCLLALHLTQS